MATRRMARRQSLVGNLTDVQRRLRFLESQPTKYRLASQVVRRTNIQPKAVSTDQLADSAVTNAVIADNSITSEKIGENQVVNSNIGNDAVTDRNIAPDSIDSSMIKNGEVQTEDLDDDAVTNAKLAPNAVERDNIKDGEVVNSKLGEGAVTTSKILNGQVTTDKIGNLQVTNEKLAADSVGTGKIRDLNVTTGKIANDAITTVKIANGQVSTAKLSQGAVTTDKIDTRAVTGIKIAESTITRGKLTFVPVGTVTAGDGLGGGGSGETVTLRVDNTVSRSGHRHDSLYAPVSHPHPHTHPLSGTTDSGGAAPNQAHRHFFGTTTGQPSSLRYKKDITNYSFDVSKLLDTNLVSFKYLNQYKDKKANRELFYGYIAEDIAANGLEEILCYDENGQPNAVNYSLVGVLTLELVKMQEKRIKELENKIAEMSGDND